jgi:hypothetical protein
MEISVLIALGIGLVLGIAICRTFSNGDVDGLRNEAERLRMQLAGCGVAAMGNTTQEVAKRLDRSSPYWSASYGDVCAAVDREMRLRDVRDIEVREFIGWLSGDIEELHCVEVPRLAVSWEHFRAAKVIAADGQEAR